MSRLHPSMLTLGCKARVSLMQQYRQEEENDTKPERDRGFTVTHSHVMHPKEAVMKVSHCSNGKGN